MMRLKALEVTDFGPFKGTQTVTFPPGEGVTVFYGENMRGKTSLLNAIRFVFLGSIKARGSRNASLHLAGNWERHAEGKFGFQVALDFSHEGKAYTLTRVHRPRHGVTTPQGDDDYHTEVFLRRDGDVLGPQECASELQRILPEQISRFFLFDGELLQEYEDLLSNDAGMGPQISEAIERILGVPVLTMGRATLAQAKSAAEKRAALAAQGDHRTREYGTQLEQLLQERGVLEQDLARHTQKLEDARKKRASLEEALKKKERFTVLLEKRDGLDHQIDDLMRRRDDLRARLKAAMSGAWTTLLSAPIHAAVATLSSKENDLRNAIARIEVLASMSQHSDGECPACLQKIGPDAKRKIEAAVGHSSSTALEDKRKQLSDLNRRLDAARGFAGASTSASIQMCWDLLEDADREFFAKRDQREDLGKQLGEVDEASLRGVKIEYETNLLEINALVGAVQVTRKKLDEKETAIDHVRRRLERASTASGGDAQKRARLYTDLHDLFSAAVDAYRERLRKSVEADATKHFLRLTTEQEYQALSINDSYGLTIVHRDGEHIPVRSAGAEHVVALSLIGALQNNAPLRGPIVIDSPFGRLDSGHTRNIVRALPTMAEQVVLLVYEEELPPALARAELQGKLLAEYQLDRRSARHTELAPKV